MGGALWLGEVMFGGGKVFGKVQWFGHTFIRFPRRCLDFERDGLRVFISSTLHSRSCNTYNTTSYLSHAPLFGWRQRSRSASAWQRQRSSYATSHLSPSIDDLTYSLGPRRTRSVKKIPWRHQRDGKSILQRRFREDDEQKRSGLDIRGRVRLTPIGLSPQPDWKSSGHVATRIDEMLTW